MSPNEVTGTLCVDPGRAAFYDRVGRFFEATDCEGGAVGRCSLCGGNGVVVWEKSGRSVCRAQRAITEKRRRPLGDLEPAFGVPVDPSGRGSHAFNSPGTAVLIERSRVKVITNIVPSAPLPTDMSAERVKKGQKPNQIARLLIGAVKRRLERPFLLVIFQQKSTTPFMLGQSPSTIPICGDDPVIVVETARLCAAMEFTGKYGAADFRSITRLKAKLVAGSPDVKSIAMADIKVLASRHADLASDFAAMPTAGEPEVDLAVRASEDATEQLA